ncbi:peptidylprolyl isomerase [Lacticaseibacillus jixianensis]|uniref:Foldase protein PrsA n=1 Tax=Lacticaseibacillus jixianensis TaxID=2486012 RepID=A0ABW4BB82_9LACO|nr:peptidylprolyl isomerase [Lacticaseibacillus jixianensis]
MQKWIRGVLLAVASFGVVATAGCAQQGSAATDKTVIAQYAGSKVTQKQFYAQLKAQPASKTVLANMLVYGAMNHAYGKQVPAQKVTAAYNSYRDQYGDGFASFLSQNNYTKQTFRQMLRLNYLSVAAMKAQMKPTTAQLKTAWQSYQPTVTVDHIQTTSQATAQQVIAALNAGQDFGALAAQYSVDAKTSNTGGELKLASTDKDYDSTFKKAAYQLKKGEVTQTPVKTTAGYEVIKMVKHPARGSFAAHRKQLTAQLYQQWASNSTVMKNVVSQVLKDEKVKITDKHLASALNAYRGATVSATSDKQ